MGWWSKPTLPRVCGWRSTGAREPAFVDRPHLAKVLRVWRLTGGRLAEVASLQDVTNHQIGWESIAGGLQRRSLGPLSTLADIDAALACH